MVFSLKVFFIVVFLSPPASPNLPLAAIPPSLQFFGCALTVRNRLQQQFLGPSPPSPHLEQRLVAARWSRCRHPQRQVPVFNGDDARHGDWSTLLDATLGLRSR